MPIANAYPEKSASHIVPNADPRLSVLVVTVDSSYAPTGIIEEPVVSWHFIKDAEGPLVRAAVPLHPSSGSGHRSFLRSPGGWLEEFLGDDNDPQAFGSLAELVAHFRAEGMPEGAVCLINPKELG